MMFKNLSKQCLVFLTCFSFLASHAEASGPSMSESAPESMASLGDSISAGVLAAYSRSDANSPMLIVKMTMDVIQMLTHRSSKSIEKRYLSWSTGIDPFRRVNSHAYRLKALNPNLKIYEGAVSGADSYGLDRQQVKKLLQWSKINLRTNVPDYTTIMVGANDICGDDVASMTSIHEFQNNIQNSLHAILEAGTTNKVLVVDLPAVDQVRNNERTALMRFRPFSSCNDLWKRMPICKNMLRDFKPEHTALVRERVEMFNQVLADVVSDLRKDYGDRVRFAPTVNKGGVGPDDIAADCFHPNVVGQRNISQGTWDQSWWSNSWFKAPRDQEKTYNIDPEWFDL